MLCGQEIRIRFPFGSGNRILQAPRYNDIRGTSNLRGGKGREFRVDSRVDLVRGGKPPTTKVGRPGWHHLSGTHRFGWEVGTDRHPPREFDGRAESLRGWAGQSPPSERAYELA